MNQLLNFFGQNSWIPTFLGGAFLSSLGWIFTARWKPRKSLRWNYSTKKVLDYSSSLKSDLKVSFKGCPIDSLWMTNIELYNTGNTELNESDFKYPISLIFEGTRILTAEAVKNNIACPSIRIIVDSDTKATLDIDLFNPGEKFDIVILTTKERTPKIDGRIVGISEIKKFYDIRNLLKSNYVFLGLAPPITAIFFLTNYAMLDPTPRNIALLTVAVTILTPLIFALIKFLQIIKLLSND